jgi:hypothetical protein
MTILLEQIKENGGFMNKTQLQQLAIEDRLRLVLVRTALGRFLSPAQDAETFITYVDKDINNHVRDVCLPSNDPIFAEDFHS